MGALRKIYLNDKRKYFKNVFEYLAHLASSKFQKQLFLLCLHDFGVSILTIPKDKLQSVRIVRNCKESVRTSHREHVYNGKIERSQ